MDWNYLDRLKLRRRIIREHHETVIQAAPSIRPAVRELYVWLVGTYLPTRFPLGFERREGGNGVLNTATGEVLPLAAPSDPVRVFEMLGENLDEDFLILEKEVGSILTSPKGEII